MFNPNDEERTLDKKEIEKTVNKCINVDFCSKEFGLKIIDTFQSIKYSELRSIIILYPFTKDLTKDQLLSLVGKGYDTLAMSNYISLISTNGPIDIIIPRENN